MIGSRDNATERSKTVPCGRTNVEGSVVNPVSIVKCELERVELAMTSKQSSELAHRQLAVVCDLPGKQIPTPATRHL